MGDLTAEDERLISSVLEDGVKARWTHERSLAEVSRRLEAFGYEGDRRAEVFYEGVRRAAGVDLKPDAVEPGRVQGAVRILRETGAVLAKAPWRETVRTRWPAPIAFEVERLIQELDGRMDGGERLQPSPSTALLQMRDAYEMLIKVCAVMMLRTLIEAGGEGGAWAQARSFQVLHLGTWLGSLRDGARRVRAIADAPPPIKALAMALLARGVLTPGG